MLIRPLWHFVGISAIAHVFAPDQKVMQQEDDLSRRTLVQPVFGPFTLGSIKPLGWIKDQLELEAAGLAGNMFDFYRFVEDAKWIGGSTEYSILDEASPYWFNGLVPLAFGLNDSRIKGQVKYYLDYVLDHQQEDGWLGFEETHEDRGIWARCLLLLGLMQYAEADPSETERIVGAMHRYVLLAHSMLQDNYTGLIVHGNDTFDPAGFGVGRTHEMHIPLQWLYDKYPRNNSEILWETMELMIEGGVVWGADWRTFWVEGIYPETYYEGATTYNMSWVFLHGVNQAQGLRYPLSVYRMIHDDDLKVQTRTAVDLTEKYHKSLAGSIIADEYIADLRPSRGAELCTAAEMIFSLSYIYQFLPDNDLADWVEQTAFNAFPASVSSDWWSHQYVQQENQPWARNLTEGPDLWYDVSSYSNVFGLEPNYPCCTVNHPQAYPKYLANSFMLAEGRGISHILLGPASLSTTLGENRVSISTNTNYPFDLSITYMISAESAFDFYVRIPTWASSSSKIEGPAGEPNREIKPSDNGLQRVQIPASDRTVFTVHIDTQPRVRMLPNNTVAIYYGALLYSLAIESNTTQTAPLNYRDQTVLDPSTTHPHTHDHVIVPTSPWAIAIDPSQIAVVQAREKSQPLPNPIWDLGAPPAELRVAAVEINWPLEYDTPADPPLNPVAAGEPFSARFVPYGSAKLHMAQLPVLTLPQLDLLAAKSG